MDRSNFQRLLSLVDTIHDYKSSDRIDIYKDENINREEFRKIVMDELIPQLPKLKGKPYKEGEAKAKLKERIKESKELIQIDLAIKLSNFPLNIKVLPDYIIEFIENNPNITSKEIDGDCSLIDFLDLVYEPQRPYNPSNLIELLMLTFIHDGFRESLGLKEKQRYISNRSNCSNINFIKSNSSTNEVNSSAQKFCEDIYSETYPDNSLYKPVGKIEEKMEEVVYDFLKTDEIYNKDITTWNEIKGSNYGSNIKYIKIELGNKKDKTGIFGISTENQIMEFQKIVNKFFKTDVYYVYDSNGLSNEWMESKRYKGKFVDYDSCNQDSEKNKKKLQNVIPVNNDELEYNVVNAFGGALVSSYNKEFQQYKLSKKHNELLFIDEISIIKDNNIFEVYRVIDNDYKKIDTDERSKGLPLFLKLFNEINRKTLGYKVINGQTTLIKKQLISGINNVGLIEFKKMYRITLGEADNDKSYTRLNRDEFVKALFDLKRSMDYFYVKATLTANMREKLEANKDSNSKYRVNSNNANILKNPQERKFAFVSRDLSAILYSLFLNNPTIRTTTSGGTLYMELFNPSEVFYNYDEIIDEYKAKNLEPRVQVKVPQVEPQSQAQSEDFAQVEPQVKNIRASVQEKLNEEYQGKTATLKKCLDLLGKLDTDKNEILVDGKSYQLDKCSEWLSRFKNTIYKYNTLQRICHEYNRSRTGGANNSQVQKVIPIQAQVNSNSNSNAKKSLLDEQIPLDDLESICEFGSPFYIFLHFYGQLTPSISFFWFITFKTLMFLLFGDDMDQHDCVRFVEMNRLNTQVRQPQQSRSQPQQVKQNVVKKTNNNIRQNNNTRLRPDQEDQYTSAAPAAGGKKKLNKNKKK
jgi:hypothetical protein